MKIIIIDKEKNLYNFDVDNKRAASYIKEQAKLFELDNLEDFIKKLYANGIADFKKINLNENNLSAQDIADISFEPTYYGISMFDLHNKVFLTAFNDYDNINSILSPEMYFSPNVITDDKQTMFKNFKYILEKKYYICEDLQYQERLLKKIDDFLNGKTIERENTNFLLREFKLNPEFNIVISDNVINSSTDSYLHILKNVLSYKFQEKTIKFFLQIGF